MPRNYTKRIKTIDQVECIVDAAGTYSTSISSWPDKKYHFYARIKRSTDKQHYALLIGRNNEVVFTGERQHNRKDVVDLLKSWFPGVEIKK